VLSAQTNYTPEVIQNRLCFTFEEGTGLLDIINNKYPKEILKNAEREKIIDKLEKKLEIKRKQGFKTTMKIVLIAVPPALILGFILGVRIDK
jgi:hypothetical protein